MKQLAVILVLLCTGLPVAHGARDSAGNRPRIADVRVVVERTVPIEVAPLLKRTFSRFLSFRLGQKGYMVDTSITNPSIVITASFERVGSSVALRVDDSGEAGVRWIVAPPLDSLRVTAVIAAGPASDTLSISTQTGRVQGNVLPPGAVALMRAADSVVACVPVTQRVPPATATAGRQIPVQMYVDRSFRARYPETWEERVHRLISTTSLSLEGQLGAGLDLQYTMPVDVGGTPDMNLLQAHYAMHAQKPMSSEMLVIGLYGRHVDGEIGGMHRDGVDKIGYASLARRRVTMTDIDLPEDLRHWWPFVMSHILAHEIYHALAGALHVWQVDAVMNPLFTWSMSGRVDSVNAALFQSVVIEQQPAGSKAEYAQRVVDAVGGQLRTSLIDWPQFACDFSDVLASEMKTPDIDSLMRKDLITAAFGVELLKSTDSTSRARSADAFARLSARYPNEASFWYWLSRSSSGSVADTALAKAAEMGYYPAQMELERGTKW